MRVYEKYILLLSLPGPGSNLGIV